MLEMFRMAVRGVVPVTGPFGARYSIVHAEDLARGILAAYLRADGVPRIYNVAEPVAYTWPEIAAHIGGAVGRDPWCPRIPTPVAWLVGRRRFAGEAAPQTTSARDLGQDPGNRRAGLGVFGRASPTRTRFRNRDSFRRRSARDGRLVPRAGMDSLIPTVRCVVVTLGSDPRARTAIDALRAQVGVSLEVAWIENAAEGDPPDPGPASGAVASLRVVRHAENLGLAGALEREIRTMRGG
jgi:hypothetical protein